MGLRPLEIFYSFRAGIDFRRQILTSKVGPRFERAKLLFQTSLGYINPFNPEFTIVIFIHYKPRIAVAILDL